MKLKEGEYYRLWDKGTPPSEIGVYKWGGEKLRDSDMFNHGTGRIDHVEVFDKVYNVWPGVEEEL